MPTAEGGRPATFMCARTRSSVWLASSPGWNWGNHPSEISATRLSTGSAMPPIHTGMGRWTGSGLMPARSR